MTDNKAPNLDGRRLQPDDNDAILSETQPEMHPAVGKFLAAIDELVDDHLTSDKVEVCLERVLHIATGAALPEMRAHHHHLQRRQGVDDAQVAARTPQTERLLTVDEVAALCRVDPKTVTRWAAAGRIGSVRTPGGPRRFRETDVRAMLASLTDSVSSNDVSFSPGVAG